MCIELLGAHTPHATSACIEAAAVAAAASTYSLTIFTYI